jgi:hypothetical protein
MGVSWSRHKLHPVVSTLSAHEHRKETHYFIKLYSAVLKYCAIALQAAVEEKLRQNTMNQRYFKLAIKTQDGETIYSTLKALNLRSHKKQNKWRYPSPAELPPEIYRDSDHHTRLFDACGNAVLYG